MSKVFPKWSNALPLQIVIFLAVLGTTVAAGVTYYATPKYTRAGYAPVQPVPFSHRIHVNDVGLSCLYCHQGVDKGPHSTIPSAQTCMNCHSIIKKDSPLLAPVREAVTSGNPVPWVKVHVAPDYVYFNHAVHVNRGVSCVECHGKVNEMDTVTHTKPLSMGFCLDCHRDPAKFIREPKDIYNLDSSRLSEQGRADDAVKFVQHWKVNPPQSCSGCHR